MKAYRVKVSVRNNLLLNAIEKAGYKSVTKFERSAGIAIGRANCLVAMRDSPIQQTGEFSKIAKLMMEALRLLIFGLKNSLCSSSARTSVGAK